MTAFRAIVKITLMSAVRSKVFISLLLLLLGAVVLIPLMVEGDGTALAHVKVSIEYSLGAISMILSLSCVWIGCHVMSSDLEGYQAHMVMVKPVRRSVVWAGKYVGVALLHAFLLVVSCIAVFCLIEWRLSRTGFPANELKRIRAEVLVGREITHCELSGVDALIASEFERKLKIAENAGQALTSMNKTKMYGGTVNEVMSQIGEVKPGAMRQFDFSGLENSVGLPLSLRYKVFAGGFTTKKQYSTMAGWGIKIRIPQPEGGKSTRKQRSTRTQQDGGRSIEEAFLPLTEDLEKILSNYYYEVSLPPEALLPGGKLSAAFFNAPESEASLFFQVNETPQILSQRTGFLGNFSRAAILILMGVFLISGISCSLGGLLSMPIAVFTVIAYLLFGTLSSYLIVDGNRGEVPSATQEDPATFVGRHVGKALLMVITPLQKFDASSLVASGTLVTASALWKVFAFQILLKGTPLIAFGVFLYSKREIGMIVRK